MKSEPLVHGPGSRFAQAKDRVLARFDGALADVSTAPENEDGWLRSQQPMKGRTRQPGQ
jgi:hypothetical protein